MIAELIENIDSGADEAKCRFPNRRIAVLRAPRIGSGLGRSVVQLRRVRSEQSGNSHPCSWSEDKKRNALASIITF
jgi:hypothetical protein